MFFLIFSLSLFAFLTITLTIILCLFNTKGFVALNVLIQLKKYKNFEITVIDSKDYFDFNPASLRVLVEVRYKM